MPRLMPWGKTTLDGRCWACNQRRRFHPEATIEWEPEGDHRHAIKDGVALCTLPRVGIRSDPARRAQLQREYTARRKAKGWVEDPAAAKRRRLKHHYGITQEDADALLAAQGGVCAICGDPDPTDIDHDHVTGAVRGILCGPCNRMLGQAKDDPERLIQGAAYLASWSVDGVAG